MKAKLFEKRKWRRLLTKKIDDSFIRLPIGNDDKFTDKEYYIVVSKKDLKNVAKEIMEQIKSDKERYTTMCAAVQDKLFTQRRKTFKERLAETIKSEKSADLERLIGIKKDSEYILEPQKEQEFSVNFKCK